MGHEIERKFFCDPSRLGKASSSTKLEQGYLTDTGGTEIRLRRSPSATRLTLKSGDGAERFEWELPLPAAEFESLWPRATARIVKVRQRFPVKKLVIEVDRYEGDLEGLVTAEVEFSSLTEARDFSVPSALGPELTWDPRFKNRSLATAPSVPRGLDRGLWSYGVLPYRRSSRGLELVVVTTRRHDRWIVPKGQPESGRTAKQVALAEAQEEAGLSGRITGHPLVLPYARENGTTNLLLFPLLVTRLDDRWLEFGQRERRIVPLAEAADYGDVVRLGAQAVLEMTGTVGS